MQDNFSRRDPLYELFFPKAVWYPSYATPGKKPNVDPAAVPSTYRLTVGNVSGTSKYLAVCPGLLIAMANPASPPIAGRAFKKLGLSLACACL